MEAVQGDLRLKAKLYRGLGDRSRLAILEAILDGPMNVGQIVAETGLSQPNASMHLDCLYCCGVVDRERRGRYVYYRIKSRRTTQLLEVAERALAEVAEHIEACEQYRD